MVSILFVMTLLLGGGISEGDSRRLRQAGFAEFQLGHYLKAEEFIRKAVDAAETTNDAYEAALGYSLLGEIQHAERQFAQAEKVRATQLKNGGTKPPAAPAATPPQVEIKKQ